MEKKYMIAGGVAAGVLLLLILKKRSGGNSNADNISQVAGYLPTAAVYPISGGGYNSNGNDLTSTFGNDAVSAVAKTLAGNGNSSTSTPTVGPISSPPTSVYAPAPPVAQRPIDAPSYTMPSNPDPNKVYALDSNVLYTANPNAPQFTYQQVTDFANKYRLLDPNNGDVDLSVAYAAARQYSPNMDYTDFTTLLTAASRYYYH